MKNKLLVGDCRDRLRDYPDNYFDACIVDTPYELGFMGKAWDKTGIAYDVPTWQQVLRVLKPGAHLLAFGGSRTYHRIACAIEDAGFEIRDQIMWLYGSGFPKSLDVSKALDKALGAERAVVGVRTLPNGKEHNYNIGFGEDGFASKAATHLVTAATTPEAQQWAGWGTALKPAHEPICVARKPLEKGLTVAANVLKWGTGALNVDGCRIAGAAQNARAKKGGTLGYSGGNRGNMPYTGAAGRWPANLIHDGSEEAVALFPQSKGQQGNVRGDEESKMTGSHCYGGGYKRQPAAARNDTGSAARFFYCAKASTAERGEGNDHPCVKPQKLLRYLARLVTPPGGRILDHFTGSGSGPLAFTNEGFAWDAIDLDPHNIAIAKRRLEAQQQQAGLYAVSFNCP